MSSLSPFRKCLVISSFVHAFVFLFLAFNPFVSFQKPLFEDRITWLSLPLGATESLKPGLAQSEQLPKSTVQEQKEVALPAAPKAKSEMVLKLPAKKAGPKKAEPKPVSAAEKSRLAEATARQARNDVMARALSRVSTDLKTRRPATPEAAQIPKNQPGGVPFGTAGAQYASRQDPEYLLYQVKVRERIMKQWIVPIPLKNSGLTCEIIVLINGEGTVTQTEWKRRSGSEVLDLSALRAIERASPLDIPPPKLQYEALTEGFLVEFSPERMEQ